MIFKRFIAVAAVLLVFLCAAARACFADIIYSVELGPDSHLFRINPDTGDEEQITYNDFLDRSTTKHVNPSDMQNPDMNELIELLEVRNIYPTVSKDGKRVAYSSFRRYRDEGLRIQDDWNGQGYYPAIEFYLFFYSYFPTTPYFTRHKSLNWNIYMLDMESGKERQISNFLWDEFQPQFMPRGSDVLYVLKAEKSLFVLRGARSGKSFQQVTLKNNQAVRPQVSPDGRTLLYQSFRDYNWELFTMRISDLPSERVESRLTATTYVNEIHPHWSPDASKILFLANRPGFQSFYDICVMDMNSGEKTYLTKQQHVSPDAAFSPDSSRIAFTSNVQGNYVLYTILPDGKDKKQLTSSATSVFFPEWSPDGSRIAYLQKTPGPGSTTYSLMISNADGSGQKKISKLPATLSPMAWF